MYPFQSYPVVPFDTTPCDRGVTFALVWIPPLPQHSFKDCSCATGTCLTTTRATSLLTLHCTCRVQLKTKSSAGVPALPELIAPCPGPPRINVPRIDLGNRKGPQGNIPDQPAPNFPLHLPLVLNPHSRNRTTSTFRIHDSCPFRSHRQ